MFKNCARHITSSCMEGLKNYSAKMTTTTECVACKEHVLGQRPRSQLALKICAFQNHVRPLTSSCMVGFENYLVQMIIMTRCIACKNHASRSKSALKVCAFQNRVQSFTLSCMAVLKINLTEMIITTRQCVMSQNHVTRSKIEVTVRTYSLCIGVSETCSCQAHNFHVMHASGMG